MHNIIIKWDQRGVTVTIQNFNSDFITLKKVSTNAEWCVSVFYRLCKSV